MAAFCSPVGSRRAANPRDLRPAAARRSHRAEAARRRLCPADRPRWRPCIPPCARSASRAFAKLARRPSSRHRAPCASSRRLSTTAFIRGRTAGCRVVVEQLHFFIAAGVGLAQLCISPSVARNASASGRAASTDVTQTSSCRRKGAVHSFGMAAVTIHRDFGADGPAGRPSTFEARDGFQPLVCSVSQMIIATRVTGEKIARAGGGPRR